MATTVSFKAAEVNIEVQRRDSPVIPVTISQNGSALDITGGTFTLTVDPEPTPADALNNVFQVAGVIADGPAGSVTFQPTTANLDIEPGTYFYDIQMTLNGTTRTVLKGQFIVDGDITI